MLAADKLFPAPLKKTQTYRHTNAHLSFFFFFCVMNQSCGMCQPINALYVSGCPCKTSLSNWKLIKEWQRMFPQLPQLNQRMFPFTLLQMDTYTTYRFPFTSLQMDTYTHCVKVPIYITVDGHLHTLLTGSNKHCRWTLTLYKGSHLHHCRWTLTRATYGFPFTSLQIDTRTTYRFPFTSLQMDTTQTAYRFSFTSLQMDTYITYRFPFTSLQMDTYTHYIQVPIYIVDGHYTHCIQVPIYITVDGHLHTHYIQVPIYTVDGHLHTLHTGSHLHHCRWTLTHTTYRFPFTSLQMDT